MKLTTQELDKMQSVDIGATNADTLSDVSGMAFQKGLSREERITSATARFGLRDRVSQGWGFQRHPCCPSRTEV